ncbi:MAG: Na+/H+ antiporter subunit E [Pseudomonadota bacterium]
MSRLVILTVALAGLWLLLSGYFDKPLLLAFGVVSVAVSVYLAARAGVLDGEGVPDGLMPRVFGYWGWLFLEIGKANIQVARHALAIDMKLSPSMMRIKSPTRTNAGLATFCNSVTLTPGTVTIDLEPDHFLVHALAPEFADEEAILDMGRRVAELEGGAAPDGDGA